MYLWPSFQTVRLWNPMGLYRYTYTPPSVYVVISTSYLSAYWIWRKCVHWRSNYGPGQNKSKMAAAAIWNFIKSVILSPVTVVRFISICEPNFMQIFSLAAEIMLKIANQIWRPPPSWISNEGYFRPLVNVAKCGANKSRTGRDTH